MSSLMKPRQFLCEYFFTYLWSISLSPALQSSEFKVSAAQGWRDLNNSSIFLPGNIHHPPLGK